MDDVRETLDRLIRKNKDDYSGLSRMLGRNSAYIQQFIKRGSPRKLDPDDRRRLASFYGIDEEVLGGPPPTTPDGMIEIPILDVNASAGYGALATSENRENRMGFDEKWLRKITTAKAPSLSLIRVMGDSMEPTLSDGDDVLVDASDHGTRLRDGVYVIRSDETLVVKRIALRPGGKLITIASDNATYPTWNDVERESVEIIGRVIWFGRAL
tara:strand:- start:345 stop:980 length:636 start_codon:yes stop_codon:yes gene_type:complete